MSGWIDAELTTLAFCWRLDRRDGVTLGFTSHDRDLERGGVLYAATPGMLPSAISVSDGFDVDTLDVSGALTAEAITAADLESGRWDGARVALFATDWRDVDATPVPLARGELGDVGTRDGGFTAELRGMTALLERPVVEQCSPECRAELGDRRCRFDLAAGTRIVRLTMSDEARCTADATLGDGYGHGRVRWIEGPNSGLMSAVIQSDGDGLILREPPAFAVEPGTRAEIVPGCDKRFATCRDRFGNAVNFRGEPHLPGNDLLARYPGA